VQLPLLAELNRRRVFRALVGYGIAAFAVLQVLEPVMHGLHWSEAVLSYSVVALALGFPLVVTLAWIFDVRGGGIERTAPAVAAGLKRVPLALVLTCIGVLAAAPGVLYYFVVRGPGQVRTVSPAAPSIAVLPFVNMSSDKETDYFSDGITEELINSLANIDGLRVVSRTAVFALKGKTLGVDQIGSQLNVNTLLEGSVRREGNALRVTAQLINVADGYHLWSKSYDRELKSLFAVEDEIARSIAQTLQRKLVRRVALKPSTSSLEAHDLYLKGRYFWNKRNLDAFRKAAEHFEHAIQVDPEYALAYSGLADAIALRIDYDVVPAADLVPKARAAAQRALEFDPGLAEAHTSLGNLAWHEWDWTTAVREFRTAIELKPDYATARQWYAETLTSMGRVDEAKAEVARALQADPTALIINSVAANIQMFSGDYDGALERFRKTLEMDPGFDQARGGLIGVYLLKARYADAATELEKVRSWPAMGVLGARAQISAYAGRRTEALQLLRDLEEQSRHVYVPPSISAWVYVALGDADGAFAFFEKGCAEHDAGLLNIKVAPCTEPLRSDPRFKKLLNCMHLE